MTVIAILLLPAAIWLHALVDVLINEFYNFGVKLIWVVLLVILLVPIIAIYLPHFKVIEKRLGQRLAKTDTTEFDLTAY